MMPKKAMVFAAGLGTRMRPITDTIPKPLVSVANKPLLAYTLEKLEGSGVNEVVINTHYFPERIRNFCDNYGGKLKLHVLHEPELLETGGGLVNALPILGNTPFFVLNSDTIFVDRTPTALEKLASGWRDSMSAYMLLHPVDRAIGYFGKGDFELGPNGQIVRTGQSTFPYVYTGVMLFDPRLLTGYDALPFSLSEIFSRAYNSLNGELKGFYGIEHTGDWLHVGCPEALKMAEHFLQNS